MLRLLVLLFAFLNFAVGFSQSDSSRVFDLSLEFRPRFEFRNGYRQLPSDSLDPAFFTSTRSRLNVDYRTKKADFHMSIQDVRIWGQDGANPSIGTLGVFETYARFYIKNGWILKMGRQALELDNGRLFSKANWNQFSRAHDGLRLIWNQKRFSTEISAFYNQDQTALFGTAYGQNHYKYLFNHYLVYHPSSHWAIHVLNVFDGFQSPVSSSTIYVRGTSGGRIMYVKRNWGATVAAYYQYGQLSSGQSISAYYIQPEVKFHLNRLKIRVGAEYLSGNDNTVLSTVNNSFSTLYGVAFKFMGHLDYFTSFPTDVNGGGLINPYLFFDWGLSKKWRFKFESHLFFTQNNVLNAEGQIIDPYLGVETDLKIKYNISHDLFLDFGLSGMLASESMETLKTGDSDKIPVFSFLMLTWKPNLVHIKKPAE